MRIDSLLSWRGLLLLAVLNLGAAGAWSSAHAQPGRGAILLAASALCLAFWILGAPEDPA